MSNLDSIASVHIEQNLDLRQPKSSSSFRKGAGFVWLRRGTLLIADAIAIIAAWMLASIYSTLSISSSDLAVILYAVVPILGICYGVFATAKFYQSGNYRRDYVGIFNAITIVSVVGFLLFDYFHIATPLLQRSHFLLFWLLGSSSVCLGRLIVDVVTARVRKLGFGLYPVFVIADASKKAQASATIQRDGHYKIVGDMDASALDRNQREATFEKLNQLGVIEVFIDWDAIRRRLFVCSHFQSEGFTLRILPSEDLPPPNTLSYSSIGGKLCLSCTPFVFSGLEFRTKRVFDVCLAGLAVLIGAPIFLLIALLIYLDSPGPIFYKQTRIGLKDEPFELWKFRTMVANADRLQKELEAKNETKDGVLFKIRNDPRITRVGKYLRQYSLDELPQLFNVLCGEMSLVGPRPLPLRDVEKFSQHHHIRQDVLPGITGLWQISGRSDVADFEQAYQLDLSYITNWSILLDLKILLKTVGVVLQRSGAY